MESNEDDELNWKRLLGKHPIMVSVFIGSGVLGAVLGYYFLPDDWSLWRKLVGGALVGSFHGLLIIFSRMAGAWRPER